MRNNALYLAAFSAVLEACAAIVSAPEPSTGPAVQPTTRIPAPGAQRSEALLQALLALGVDYSNGGASPATGFDCSGLVVHVFNQAYGMSLPRTARDQSSVGTPVRDGELEPGDLVFYNTLGEPFSHVGIYVGNGRFVHSPKSGARVRVESMRGAYWIRRFSGARRVEPTL
jgi:cell wall-associated NlpC family hydrolase